MVGDIISERVGDFKSEWWARSSRNPGRHRSESALPNPERCVKAASIVFSKRICRLCSSTSTESIRYGLAHRQGLSAALENCRLESDTNSVENAIRSICLTRRLFAGHEVGPENRHCFRNRGNQQFERRWYIHRRDARLSSMVPAQSAIEGILPGTRRKVSTPTL
ncbi:transposase [Bradyrhizobium sp. 168]|nr:transposase [Bradyrhizobium sp. 168]